MGERKEHGSINQMRRRKVGGSMDEKEIWHMPPDSLVLRLCSVPTLVPRFGLDLASLHIIPLRAEA